MRKLMVMLLMAIGCIFPLVGCGGGSGGSGSSNQSANLANGSGSNTGNGSNSGNSTGGGSSGSGSAGSGSSGSTTGTGSVTGGIPPTGVSTTSGGTTTTQTTPTTATVVLSPMRPYVQTNSTITLSALGLDANNHAVAVPLTNWKWTSNNGAVALLTSTGDHATIVGETVGTATITATESYSHVYASITLTVYGPPVGQSNVLYFNDFSNGAGPEWTNRHTETTPGTTSHPATPFLGQMGPGTNSLTLTKIPAHNSLRLTADLYIIRSMDGNANQQNVGPDIWDLTVAGGPTLLHTTFSNINSGLALPGYALGFYQAYPDNYPAGNHPYQTGAAEVNTLGFTFFNVLDDAIYHLQYKFPHTASSVKFNFTSLQTEDVTNESWGLKNVKVTMGQ